MQAPKQDDSAITGAVAAGKRPLWPKLLTVVVLIGVTFAMISILPRGYSQDIDQIGKGGNVVVLYHDSNAVNSQQNMIAMNKLRDEFEGRVKFIVADKNVQQGVKFNQLYEINSVAFVFFSPKGEKIKVINSQQDVESLRDNINAEFHF